MAVSSILLKNVARVSLTQTLANLAAAAGQQCTMLANSGHHPFGTVRYVIKMGTTAPVAGGTIDLFLILGDDDGAHRTDGAGALNAPFTPVSATLIKSVPVQATADKVYTFSQCTKEYDPLGLGFGFAIVNNTTQPFSGNESDHRKEFSYQYFEGQ